MIPWNDVGAIHEKFATGDMMSLRDNTWKDVVALNDEIRVLQGRRRSLFAAMANEAKNNKTLCYYINCSGQLCRGFITHIDPDGFEAHPNVHYGECKLFVRMQDIDMIANSSGSIFDKDWITWHSIWQIGDALQK